MRTYVQSAENTADVISITVVNEFPDPMAFNAEVFGAGVMGDVLEIGNRLHVVTVKMDRLGAGQP